MWALPVSCHRRLQILCSTCVKSVQRSYFKVAQDKEKKRSYIVGNELLEINALLHSQALRSSDLSLYITRLWVVNRQKLQEVDDDTNTYLACLSVCMGMQPTKWRNMIHITFSIGTEWHLCQLCRVSCTYNKNIKASKPEKKSFLWSCELERWANKMDLAEYAMILHVTPCNVDSFPNKLCFESTLKVLQHASGWLHPTS
jgi:hypothetical protein